MYPDTPDIGPDSPDWGVRIFRMIIRILRIWLQKDSLLFYLIYAFCILPWLIVCNKIFGTNPTMAECRMGEPPNPPDLAQAIAAMLTGRDEKTTLLRQLVEQGGSATAKTPPTTCSWVPRVPGDPAAALSQSGRAIGSRQLA